jgi:hypothetical protein
MDDVDVRVGSFLGCAADDVIIRDMEVHPAAHNVYLSVQRGRGDAGRAVVMRIDRRAIIQAHHGPRAPPP